MKILVSVLILLALSGIMVWAQQGGYTAGVGGGTFNGGTITGATTVNVAGAASIPALTINGAPFLGTGTTSTPQLYVDAGAVEPTTWSTNGTMFGINMPSGSTGNAIDVHLNGGTSLMTLSQTGVLNPLSINGAQNGITASARIAGTQFGAQSSGFIFWSQTAPTVSSGFGTSPTITAVGTGGFTVNVGTGGTATGGVLTMPAAHDGWSCSVNDQTSRNTGTATNQTFQTANTTTSVTVTNQTLSTGASVAWAASDVLNFVCFAF